MVHENLVQTMNRPIVYIQQSLSQSVTFVESVRRAAEPAEMECNIAAAMQQDHMHK